MDARRQTPIPVFESNKEGGGTVIDVRASRNPVMGTECLFDNTGVRVEVCVCLLILCACPSAPEVVMQRHECPAQCAKKRAGEIPFASTLQYDRPGTWTTRLFIATRVKARYFGLWPCRRQQQLPQGNGSKGKRTASACLPPTGCCAAVPQAQWVAADSAYRPVWMNCREAVVGRRKFENKDVTQGKDPVHDRTGQKRHCRIAGFYIYLSRYVSDVVGCRRSINSRNYSIFR